MMEEFPYIFIFYYAAHTPERDEALRAGIQTLLQKRQSAVADKKQNREPVMEKPSVTVQVHSRKGVRIPGKSQVISPISNSGSLVSARQFSL